MNIMNIKYCYNYTIKLLYDLYLSRFIYMNFVYDFKEFNYA